MLPFRELFLWCGEAYDVKDDNTCFGCCRCPRSLTSQRLLQKKSTSVDFFLPILSRTGKVVFLSGAFFLWCGEAYDVKDDNTCFSCCRCPRALTSQRLLQKKSTSVDFFLPILSRTGKVVFLLGAFFYGAEKPMTSKMITLASVAVAALAR